MSNRKIVHQVTRQYMKRNRKRTLTTFFGIVFMVMLMTCVFVGKDTALSYLENMASMQDGKWHAIVYGANAEKYGQIKDIKYVDKTALSAECGYTEFGQSGSTERPFLQIKSYSECCFDWMNIRLTEGRFPEKDGEVILCADVLTDGADVAIGDEISAEFFIRMLERTMGDGGETIFPYYNLVLRDGEPKEAPQGFPYYGENETFREYHVATGETATYTVVGFMERPNFEDEGAAAYTALAFLDESKGLPATVNVSMQFNLKKSDQFYEELYLTAGELEMESNGILLSLSGSSSDNTINALVAVMSVFFVVLIMAASVVLVYNVFNMSFEERSRYLGMLASVGATGKQKRSSVYYEAFSLLLPALPTGFFVGLGVVKLGMLALKPYIDKLMNMALSVEMDAVKLQISPLGVAAVILLCVATVAVSAFLPARKISKVGPIECIRGNASRRKKRYGLNKLAIKCFGAEGLLASNAVKREKKKTRGLVGAVVVFMVILIVITFSTRTLTEMVDTILGGNNTMSVELDHDYVVGVGYYAEDDATYRAFVEELKEHPDTEYVVEWGTNSFAGLVPGDVYGTDYWKALQIILSAYGVTEEEYETVRGWNTTKSVGLLMVDEDTMAKLIKKAGAEEAFENNSELPPVLVVQEGEISTHTYRYEGRSADYRFCEIERMTDLQVGEVLPLGFWGYGETEPKEIPFPVTVGGFVTDEMLKDVISFHTQELWVIVGPETAERMEQAMPEEDLFYRDTMVKLKNPDGTMAQYLQELNRLDEQRELSVYRNDKLLLGDMKSAINSAIRILLICFVLLTSVICLLNLYNSVRGRISGKRKEFAMLRSVGMTERQMYKMLCLEAAEIMLRSVVVAMLISVPLVLYVKHILIQLWGRLIIVFPWSVYGIAIVIAAAAVFGMMLLCYKSEKRENILVDMRTESV